MGWYDAIKDGIQVARNAGNIELSLELAKIADDLLEKQKKIEGLEEKVVELKKKLKNKEQFILDKGVYWLASDTNHTQPFCPVCLEKDKNIPLQKVWAGEDKSTTPWSCPDKSCLATYNPWDYKETGGIEAVGGPGIFTLNDPEY